MSQIVYNVSKNFGGGGMRVSVISYWIEEEGIRISTCSSELESRKTRRDDGFQVEFSGRLYGEVCCGS